MKKIIWPVALIIGAAFDFLFWKKILGISFPVFVLLFLIAGFTFLKKEGLSPAKTHIPMICTILFSSVMTAVHKEPFTTFLNGSLTLFLMAVLAMTYLGGQWVAFGLGDYVVRMLRLIGGMFTLPWHAATSRDVSSEKSGIKTWLNHGKPVIRGILLALPVLLVFALLLSSADLIFADRMETLIGNLKLENLPETIFRGFIVLIIAYGFTGSVLYAAGRSANSRLLGTDKPVIAPFMGFTEAVIVLGGVALLFSAFVLIQLEYFFFGQGNITLDGFTYSEYARRGFGELMTTAVFTFLLLRGMGLVTKRETAGKAKTFTGLTIALVTLVLVILASAFMRLSLYESAYGFTRLRTYAHVSIIWLGILLVCMAVIEIFQRPRALANLMLAALIGFSVTLNLMNVDGFIVQQNIDRTLSDQELDIGYIASRSNDAVPALAKSYPSSLYPLEVREAIGAALACMQHSLNTTADTQKHWQSFHISDWAAQRHLQQIEDDLENYRLLEKDWSIWMVSSNGTEYPCQNFILFD